MLRLSLIHIFLWESLEWLYRHICRHCWELGIRRPRNKYADVSESYLSYCKKRKRKLSRTRMLKRRMIRLLEKLLIQMCIRDRSK